MDLLLCLLFQYDYTPIEIAVVEGNLAVVDTLFDVSARIPHIPTWSIHGIHEYLNSEEEKTQVIFLHLLAII